MTRREILSCLGLGMDPGWGARAVTGGKTGLALGGPEFPRH